MDEETNKITLEADIDNAIVRWLKEPIVYCTTQLKTYREVLGLNKND